MKYGLRVATVLGLLFVSMLIFNQALRFISTANDMAVVAGVLIFLMLVVVIVVLGQYLFKKINRYCGVQTETKETDHFRSFLIIIFLLGSVMVNVGCMKTVEPGHAGIKINQYGSQRGVQDFTIQTGAVWFNPFTENVLSYPTSVQRVIWTQNTKEGKAVNEEINYNSKDELVFTGDFTVSYELVHEKVPSFYVKFRSDDIEAFTHGFFRDQVRDSLNKVAVMYTADELYGEKKDEFLDKALALVK